MSQAPPHPEQVPTPTRRVRQTQFVAVTSLIALIVLCIGWELRWAPLPGGSGSLAIKSIPLMLALPGLLRRRLYTYRWLSLLVWLYVAEGLVRGPGDPGLSAWLAWTEAALGVVLFIACAMHVRARLQAGRDQAAAQSTTAHPSSTHA